MLKDRKDFFPLYVFGQRDEKLFCLVEEKSKRIEQVVYINIT